MLSLDADALHGRLDRIQFLVGQLAKTTDPIKQQELADQIGREVAQARVTINIARKPPLH